MLPAHRNPFRTSRLERLSFRFPPGWDMARLLQRLEALGGRGAIVGPRGSGKTTLLLELGQALEGRGVRVQHLRAGHAGDPSPGAVRAAVSEAGRGAAVLVDAGAQLGPVARLRLRRAARRARFLVVTAHRPAAMPTLIRLAVTSALLGELLRDLDPRRPVPPRQVLEDLLRRHHHDLHRVFLELFDGPTSPGTPEPIPRLKDPRPGAAP